MFDSVQIPQFCTNFVLARWLVEEVSYHQNVPNIKINLIWEGGGRFSIAGAMGVPLSALGWYLCYCYCVHFYVNTTTVHITTVTSLDNGLFYNSLHFTLFSEEYSFAMYWRINNLWHGRGWVLRTNSSAWLKAEP